MGPPRGSHVFIGLFKGKHHKILLSETTKTKALTFGMHHHLVDHFRVCSNYTPGAKNGPAPVVT